MLTCTLTWVMVLILIGVLTGRLLELALRALLCVRVESNIHTRQLQTHILHELPQLRQVAFYEVPGSRLLRGEGQLQLIASPLHLDIEMPKLRGSQLEANTGELLRLILQHSLNQRLGGFLAICQR